MSHDTKTRPRPAPTRSTHDASRRAARGARWDDQPTVNMTGDELPAARGAADAAARRSAAAEVEQARELSRAHLQGLLEALVFASDKPMKDRRGRAPGVGAGEAGARAARRARAAYAERGIVLDEIAGGWLFRTSAQFAPFVRELSAEKPVRLTRAQVETLAIVAYRQPVTRPEIDDIRGVDSGATLKLLLERDLVRILGKKDEPGRPLLYGTTSSSSSSSGSSRSRTCRRSRSSPSSPTSRGASPRRSWARCCPEAARAATAQASRATRLHPLRPPSSDDAIRTRRHRRRGRASETLGPAHAEP